MLLYQQIRAIPDTQVASGALGLFPIELFCAWITKLMLAYQEKEPEIDDLQKKIANSLTPIIRKKELQLKLINIIII